jgi:hypothetical protein
MVVEVLDFVPAFLVETMFLEPYRVSRMLVTPGPLYGEVLAESLYWLRPIILMGRDSILQDGT